MNRTLKLICVLCLGLMLTLVTNKVRAQPEYEVLPIAASSALELDATNVKYLEDLDLVVFEQKLQDRVGGSMPSPKGELDGAPVLGYVFPTTLKPEDVGFNSTEGIVALAATSHPDFDDTPLWDENEDGVYDNDGLVFHSHWVILDNDDRVAGGLAVKEFEASDSSVVMPPTHPDMQMYIDSPGYSVLIEQNSLKILVPGSRINHKTNFNFDAVTAYMEVNTSDNNRPMLGVYEVYSVSSGDLSLPYVVQN
ncbi:MAG: hypothetical protein AAGK97_16800 [Bacteroidota bacterium]